MKQDYKQHETETGYFTETENETTSQNKTPKRMCF
jgi:hypothetical protein